VIAQAGGLDVEVRHPIAKGLVETPALRRGEGGVEEARVARIETGSRPVDERLDPVGGGRSDDRPVELLPVSDPSLPEPPFGFLPDPLDRDEAVLDAHGSPERGPGKRLPVTGPVLRASAADWHSPYPGGNWGKGQINWNPLVAPRPNDD